MNPSVALVSATPVIPRMESLLAILDRRGLSVLRCSPTEPREILRWLMDLEPAQCDLCIFADTDGRMTASLITALDPAIPTIAWIPVADDPAKIHSALVDTTALLSTADNVQTFSNIVAALLRCPTDNAPSVADNASPPAAPFQNPSPSPTHEDDMAMYEQLETLMATPVKDRPRPEPVQIQLPGIDFTLPLRKLMSKGKEAAHRESHAEVLGVHYLSELDEPYLSLFNTAGLSPSRVAEYLKELEKGSGEGVEPVISEEVFNAVALAKQAARSRNAECIRVSDFIKGLLQAEAGSVAETLNFTAFSVEGFLDHLAKLETSSEACASSFFEPSSLDQESFYQFDPDAVRSAEERLRSLPGFQKAAKRVAENRPSSPTGSAPKPEVVAMPAVATEIPEVPEIMRIAGDFPPVDVVEYAADNLLDGQVVAFPSDIMFALVADATNPIAVDRLRQAAQLDDDKRLSILIHSTSQLKHLVRANLDALEDMLDAFWPGPLTLIFQAAIKSRYRASDGTVAVRLPSDNVSLAILSMLGRPLVVSSYNRPADSREEELAGHVALILDNKMPSPMVQTTILDITKSPWEIVREGAIPPADILQYDGQA